MALSCEDDEDFMGTRIDTYLLFGELGNRLFYMFVDHLLSVQHFFNYFTHYLTIKSYLNSYFFFAASLSLPLLKFSKRVAIPIVKPWISIAWTGGG